MPNDPFVHFSPYVHLLVLQGLGSGRKRKKLSFLEIAAQNPQSTNEINLSVMNFGTDITSQIRTLKHGIIFLNLRVLYLTCTPVKMMN